MIYYPSSIGLDDLAPTRRSYSHSESMLREMDIRERGSKCRFFGPYPSGDKFKKHKFDIFLILYLAIPRD